MEFTADLDNLDQMLTFIRSEAVRFGIQDDHIRKLELACEEAIVNIISYAYPEKKGKLEIYCRKNGHRFEILLRDYGIPFNPIDVDVNPQIDIPVDERKIGGLGIYIIRKAMDEASYQRIDDKNELRLTLCFE